MTPKEERYLKVREKREATKAKRGSQLAKVYSLKINTSWCSKSQLNHLKMLFVEAKWIYNFVLEKSNKDELDSFRISYKDYPTIWRFNKDHEYVETKLENLSAQMRQDLFLNVKNNILSLSKAKKKGYIVGGLKFKSEVTSVPLRQHKVTWKITNNKLKIQGFKKLFKVHGLDQIHPDFELADAKLVNHGEEFWIHITTFQKPQKKKKTGKAIGLDFGLKTAVTLSDGQKLDWSIPETKKLKHLQRSEAKKKKGSKNRFKTRLKINKEYRHVSNTKRDIKNKVISKLCLENDIICIQDDNIQSWKMHKNWGAKLQHSIIGAIKSGLKEKPETLVVGRFYASTKTCSRCGAKQEMELDDRIYDCPFCGLSIDRDLNSALNILQEGIKQIPMDCRKSTLVETLAQPKSLKQENGRKSKRLPKEDAQLQRA